MPNLFEYKYKRIFGYKPLKTDEATHEVSIGIPRVLNMYENYPFWHTFFTKLGFPGCAFSGVYPERFTSLVLNPFRVNPNAIRPSLRMVMLCGLLQKGINTIFYPCVPYERNEIEGANNHYNCPIVTSYAENIKNNMEELS